MYSYVVTSQKSTAVQHAVTCNFTDANDSNLILARGNRLEVYTFHESVLRLDYETSLYGIIASLNSYRPHQSFLDVILILTERKQFCTLSYDKVNKKVVTLTTGSLKDKIARDLDSGGRALVDPEFRMLAISMYEGSLKIIPIDGETLREAFNVRLDVLRYIDIKFLHGCPRPTLCVLLEDNKRNKHIKTFIVDQRERELIAGPWSHSFVDGSAYTLIPVPSPTNGVLIVGEKAITYVNSSATSPSQSVIIDHAQITSYCLVESDGTRFFLGDQKGNLYVLILSLSSSSSSSSSSTTMINSVSSTVKKLFIDRIGTANISSCLCYLNSGVVFIGSIYGDSQLIQFKDPSNLPSSTSTSVHDNVDDDIDDAKMIQQQPLFTDNVTVTISDEIELLHTLPNIGPVLDMCVIQSDTKMRISTGRGQSKLVTCSGAYKDGSIRVISSGIGIQEQASLEMPGIKGMWSMKGSVPLSSSTSTSTSYKDKYIVMSFVADTRVLAIEDNELGEFEITGFSYDETSIYVTSLMVENHIFLIQVTPSSLRIVKEESLELIYEYNGPSTLIAARVTLLPRVSDTSGDQHSNCNNTIHVVLAAAGGKLIYFSLKIETTSVAKFLASGNKSCKCTMVEEKSIILDNDVACLSIYSASASAPSSTVLMSSNQDMTSPLLALGMWTDNTIRLLNLFTLKELLCLNLGTSEASSQSQSHSAISQAQARDMLFSELDDICYLFVGLGDGTLIYYQLAYSPHTGDDTFPSPGDSHSHSHNEWVLNHRKKVVLGVRALSLTLFINATSNTPCVFIACDRATIIYSHHKKLLFSCVNMSQEIIHMSPFNSELFPHCLALSSDTGFLIGTIDDIQKLHIQSYYLGNSPRRLAYHSTTGTLAVCIERMPLSMHNKKSSSGSTTNTTNNDIILNQVIFYNESTMQPFYTFDSDPLEQFISCYTCYLGPYDSNNNNVNMGSDMNDNKHRDIDVNSTENNNDNSNANVNINDKRREYIVVGSAYLVPSEVEPSHGRILIFEITPSVNDSEEFHVSLVVEKETKGAVFALNYTCGKLVASVGHKVLIMSLNTPSTSSLEITSSSSSSSLLNNNMSSTISTPTLTYECGNAGHIMSLHVKVHGQYILLGDLMRSMTLLQYKLPTQAAASRNTTTTVNTTSMNDSVGHDNITTTGAITSTTTVTSTANGTLEEVARDFGANMMRSVEILGDSDDIFLGTDDAGNLFTVKRQSQAETEEERGKMDPYGYFHVGDWINVIKQGSLNTQPRETLSITSAAAGNSSHHSNTKSAATTSMSTASFHSTHSYLFGTVNGGIGTILTLTENHFKFFNVLEKAIKSVVTSGVGGFAHEDYRSFCNERRIHKQKAFIDGDLIEKLLDMTLVEQTVVVRYLNDELALAASTAATSINGQGVQDKTAGKLKSNEAGTNLSINTTHKMSTDVMSHMMTETSIFHPNYKMNSYTVDQVIHIVEDFARLH